MVDVPSGADLTRKKAETLNLLIDAECQKKHIENASFEFSPDVFLSLLNPR